MPVCEADPWRVQYFEAVLCPADVMIPTEDSDAWMWNPRESWIYNKLRVAESQVRVNAAALDDVAQQLKFAESLTDKSAISSEELTRRRSAVETAQARLDEARAQVAAAAAQIEMVQTQIERSLVRAPVDGEVLQVKIHPGEFAPAGVTATPLVLLGRLKPLHIRVDVDEILSPSLRSGSR